MAAETTDTALKPLTGSRAETDPRPNDVLNLVKCLRKLPLSEELPEAFEQNTATWRMEASLLRS